jgi:hypothetical protein
MEIILLWLLEKSFEQLLEVLFAKLVDWLLEKRNQHQTRSPQSSVKNLPIGEIEEEN